MDFEIRRALAEDAETVARVGRETFLETFIEGFRVPYPPDDLEHFMAHAYTASFNAGRLADPEQAVWLVEREGRAVGYAAAGPAGLPHPDIRPGDRELKALYLLREAHGAGVAQRLMDTVMAWLERGGPRPLWLGVWSENLRAQRFYARYGFEKAGEYDFPVGKWRDREFILRGV